MEGNSVKKRQAARTAGQRNKMPLFLMGAGLLLIVGVLIWQASSNTPAQIANNTNLQNDIPYPQIMRISLADSKKVLDDQSAVFLDVRDPATYEAGHIPGALNIPLAQLETRLSELDANRLIVTYCT
jgi:3-mercaptopyruvate sulfurtransferase SseA